MNFTFYVGIPKGEVGLGWVISTCSGLLLTKISQLGWFLRYVRPLAFTFCVNVCKVS